MTEDRKHSKVGASISEQWWNCPGSVKLSEGLPDSLPKEYAAEGTVAHAIAQEVLEKRMSMKTLQTYLGLRYEQDGFEIKVTKEMLDAIQYYVFDTILPEASLAYLDVYGRSPTMDELYECIETEKKIHCPEIHPEYMGTVDCRISFPFYKAIIIDFKYGAGVEVNAVENKQGLYYAAPSAVYDDVSEVKIIIVQPRMPHLKTDWLVSRQRLDEFVKDVKMRILATEQEDAELIPTEKGCHWCKAITICPKQRDILATAAQTDFMSIGIQGTPSIETLTVDQIKYILSTEKIVKLFYKAVWEYALAQAELGIPIDGYELKTKLSDRKWMDEQKVEAILKPKYDSAIYKEPELLSVARMEKFLGKEEFKKVASLVIRETTGQTLVESKAKKETLEFDGILN